MSLLETRALAIELTTGPIRAKGSFTALHPNDLSLEPGEMLGVIGESGSGRSTLANLARNDRAGRLAAVLQHPKWPLNPVLRTRDSVLEPQHLQGSVSSSEGRAKAARLYRPRADRPAGLCPVRRACLGP